MPEADDDGEKGHDGNRRRDQHSAAARVAAPAHRAYCPTHVPGLRVMHPFALCQSPSVV